jgi:hypothetical protein
LIALKVDGTIIKIRPKPLLKFVQKAPLDQPAAREIVPE